MPLIINGGKISPYPRLIPVRCGKRVADMQVRERCEFYYHLCLCLLLVAQTELHYNERLIFRAEADVVQQQNLAKLERANRLPCGGAGLVVYEPNLAFEQFGEHLCEQRVREKFLYSLSDP